jgi:hypothetical protein
MVASMTEVRRLLRERGDSPAGPRSVPEPAGPGWTVVAFDNDGTWLHIPPPLEVEDSLTKSDEKEASNGGG